jgi:hypothetical protein
VNRSLKKNSSSLTFSYREAESGTISKHHSTYRELKPYTRNNPINADKSRKEDRNTKTTPTRISKQS